MTKTYTLPVSVKGIVIDEKKVWLRQNERGEWELPGGKLEKGEQPEQTVIRELKEEIGSECAIQQLITAHVITIEGSIDESNGVLVLIYVCKTTKRTGAFETTSEGGKTNFKQFSKQEITQLNMNAIYYQALKNAWGKEVI
jgi:mutator protein MutT